MTKSTSRGHDLYQLARNSGHISEGPEEEGRSGVGSEDNGPNLTLARA
jgi:hypothetical protein